MDTIELTAPTAAELQWEMMKQLAERKAQTQRDAAPPPSDFILAGSDRPADQARARGQTELF